MKKDFIILLLLLCTAAIYFFYIVPQKNKFADLKYQGELVVAEEDFFKHRDIVVPIKNAGHALSVVLLATDIDKRIHAYRKQSLVPQPWQAVIGREQGQWKVVLREKADNPTIFCRAMVDPNTSESSTLECFSK